MKVPIGLSSETTLLVCIVTFVLEVFTVSTLAQKKAENPKLNSDFLRAIQKGDVKKMNALVAKGADVNPHSSAVDVEDVQAVPGGFRYTIKSTDLPGPSQPMRTAIQSARPEAVRTLLALGADVKAEFFLDCDPSAGIPLAVPPDVIASAAQHGLSLNIDAGSFSLHVSNGVVMSSLRPIPARKTTYLSVAEQELAASRDAKSRQGLEQIVDLLRQAEGP